MFFLQASQAPIEVQIGKLRLKLHRYTINDVVAWAQEIYDRRIREITADMDEVKRREYLSFYQPIPPDLQQMKLHLKTHEGVRRVVEDALRLAEVFDERGDPRPKLTAENIENIIRVNGAGRLSGLAIILADLDEQSIQTPPLNNNEKSTNDPLAESARASSQGSRETGATISRSSTRHTQELVREG